MTQEVKEHGLFDDVGSACLPTLAADMNEIIVSVTNGVVCLGHHMIM